MPRRTYDPAHGRPRPSEQRADYTDLRNQMQSANPAPHHQASGDQRRANRGTHQ